MATTAKKILWTNTHVGVPQIEDQEYDTLYATVVDEDRPGNKLVHIEVKEYSITEKPDGFRVERVAVEESFGNYYDRSHVVATGVPMLAQAKLAAQADLKALVAGTKRLENPTVVGADGTKRTFRVRRKKRAQIRENHRHRNPADAASLMQALKF